MPELGDLRLDKSADPAAPVPAPDASRLRLRLMLLVVAAIVLAVAGYLVLRRPAPPPAAVQAPQPTRVANDVVLAPEQPENIAVPPLDETDPLVRELVGRLSSHPKIAAWLATPGLVRNVAVVTVNIADGHTPAKQLTVLAPGSPFEASADAGKATILPSTYARYDAYGDAANSLDAHGTARLYATLKPRLDEAYRELGYPTGSFDDAVKRAFVELLKVPVVDGPIELNRSSVTYTYADSRLESLSAAQKQLLRMGPRNVRLIQAKLREIAPLIGIDPSALPR
jgi:hypothetical protein